MFVLDFIFSVGGETLGLAVAVVWLLARPSARAPRRWLMGLAIGYTLLGLPLVGFVASRPLIRGLTPFSTTQRPQNLQAIAVLGGGTFTVHGRDDKLGVLPLDAAARVLEAARIYQTIGTAPWVISSGGAPPDIIDAVPDALSMQQALVTLGVPPERILLESRSQSTHDQALWIGQMLHALRIQSFALVTSDTHMRRALATFRKQGLQPVPAIAGDRFESDDLWQILPTAESLDFNERVLHEYLGLAYYFVRGWL